MRTRCTGLAVWSILLGVVVSSTAAEKTTPTTIPWVRVAQDNRSFVLHPSGQPFAPWGLNYDHDEQGRLLEDYWEKEWPKVEADFQEMKHLGANVVRVHLQVGKFMASPEKANEANVDRLVGSSPSPRRSAFISTSRVSAVTARKMCPRGTTGSASSSGGTPRPSSGRPWPNDAPRARRSSATI